MRKTIRRPLWEQPELFQSTPLRPTWENLPKEVRQKVLQLLLSNDRLLLGLKGSLNEYELDLLRQRSLEARRAKAKRGELIVAAPVGYLKTSDQRLEKDPDRRVQEALLLVFRKFLEIVAVVQPAAVEVALMASEQSAQGRDDVLAALQRDLEAARYAMRRAEKQYQAADPDNRLITQELERRWNQTLEHVQELEQRIADQQAHQSQVTVPNREELQGLAADLDKVWNDPRCDARLKKRIVRTLIHEVVADVDAETSEVVLVIHWKGGVHTELRVPRRRRGCCQATSKDVVRAVRVLARICSDDVIAGFLNRNGLRTGRGNRWTRGRVVSLRSHHQIPCHDPDACRQDGWMNLTEAADFLGIAGATLRRAVEQGKIVGEHPLPDGPWIFQRQALETQAAAGMVKRARRNSRNPAEANPEQGNLDFSNT